MISGLALLVLALAGCGAEIVGMTGIGVTANGSPVVHLVVCRDEVDSVALVRQQGSGGTNVGRWRNGEAIRTEVALPLDDPPRSWRTVVPLVPLEPGESYLASGYAESRGVTTQNVRFTAEQLDGLRAGEILYQVYDADGVPQDTVVSAAKFGADTCAGVD